MFLSVFDLYKVGIGPLSSHTTGPMVAANRFLDVVRGLEPVRRAQVTLFGSLALTGIGYGTDRAIDLYEAVYRSLI